MNALLHAEGIVSPIVIYEIPFFQPELILCRTIHRSQWSPPVRASILLSYREVYHCGFFVDHPFRSQDYARIRIFEKLSFVACVASGQSRLLSSWFVEIKRVR